MRTKVLLVLFSIGVGALLFYSCGKKSYPESEYAVDLGLSVKWATCNVGAEVPEDYGDYFAWGETTGYNSGKTTFDWSTYKWSKGEIDCLTKYCSKESYGAKDGKLVLDSEDDVVHINWGGSWRMPTYAEMEELCTKCSWIWTTKNGVQGYEVIGPNGNYIFLPAAGGCSRSELKDVDVYGYYWSGTLTSDGTNEAYSLRFHSTRFRIDDLSFRCSGRSVRAVCP